MKATELREKPVEALNEQLIDLLKEQFNLGMRKATGQLNQSHLLPKLRRDIARVKTVLQERAGEQHD